MLSTGGCQWSDPRARRVFLVPRAVRKVLRKFLGVRIEEDRDVVFGSDAEAVVYEVRCELRHEVSPGGRERTTSTLDREVAESLRGRRRRRGSRRGRASRHTCLFLAAN